MGAEPSGRRLLVAAAAVTAAGIALVGCRRVACCVAKETCRFCLV